MYFLWKFYSAFAITGGESKQWSFFAHFASLFLSLRVLFDVKCTLNVSLSVNCAVLVTEQDTYFQIEENVNFCLMKYLKKLVS